MNRHLAVVVMAAGKGTRMKNPEIAKVMYAVDGKPMVQHVVDLALALGSERTVAIVGWQKESVVAQLAGAGSGVECVEQSPQLGTGHAVMQSERALGGFRGDVLVLSGDVPLLTRATASSLIDHHRAMGAAATVLTAILDDPSGYGRVLRGEGGDVVGIVEHKDATEEQRRIREINSGIYVFDRERLFEGLAHITPHNAQKEYYLTDVFQYFWRHGLSVQAVPSGDAREIMGVNTPEQLEEARRTFAARS